MGPLVYTSGNWRGGVDVAIDLARFNGAAGLHQRKRDFLRYGVICKVQASMGPLVYTSGN